MLIAAKSSQSFYGAYPLRLGNALTPVRSMHSLHTPPLVGFALARSRAGQRLHSGEKCQTFERRD